MLKGFPLFSFQPDLSGHKGPQKITNWGPASFTDVELELRKKLWQEKKNQGGSGSVNMTAGSHSDEEDSNCN